MIRSWGFHNLIAHPLMQIFMWLGMPRAAESIHSSTLPKDDQ